MKLMRLLSKRESKLAFFGTLTFLYFLTKSQKSQSMQLITLEDLTVEELQTLSESVKNLQADRIKDHEKAVQRIPKKKSKVVNKMQKAGHKLQVERTEISEYHLVLFTCFQSSSSTSSIHRTVIRNWSMLGPYVKPVVFVRDKDYLSEEAKGSGWDVRKVPKASEYGLPFIKDLFQDIYTTYSAKYYAYSGADLLFPDNLVNHLVTTSKYFEGISLQAPVFIVGKHSSHVYISSSELTPNPSHVAAFAKSLTQNPADFGYFITKGKAFPWFKTPELVIDRPNLGN